jgi:hypothetical protein
MHGRSFLDFETSKMHGRSFLDFEKRQNSPGRAKNVKRNQKRKKEARYELGERTCRLDVITSKPRLHPLFLSSPISYLLLTEILDISTVFSCDMNARWRSDKLGRA